MFMKTKYDQKSEEIAYQSDIMDGGRIVILEQGVYLPAI